METKIFGGKRILIRKLSKKDLRNVKKFQVFVNSLVEEDVPLLRVKKITLKEEKKEINENLELIRKKKLISLIAESGNNIVGSVDIFLGIGRREHLGKLRIAIRKEWRKKGVGHYLMEKAIKMAKKNLKPLPDMIRLEVIPRNKTAINLYKKFGFKKVAKIPKQLQYKGKLEDEIVMLLDL